MTPASSAPASIRTRVKWENLMIALIAVTVVAFAIVGYVVATAPTSEPAPTPATTAPAPTLTDADPLATDGVGELTLADATGLVEEARQLMREARWDEAAERLASVPEDLFAASGASAAALELEGSRSRYEQLRAEFDAAVQARQWADAKALFGELAAIAAPNDELLATMAQVEAGLNPPANPTTATAEPVTGGGASTAKPTPKPAAKPAAKPKPAADASRPAATTAPQSGQDTKPSGSGSSNPLAPIELSPEAEAELNAALGFAAGELQ